MILDREKGIIVKPQKESSSVIIPSKPVKERYVSDCRYAHRYEQRQEYFEIVLNIEKGIIVKPQKESSSVIRPFLFKKEEESPKFSFN